jgi:hypothetical protein
VDSHPLELHQFNHRGVGHRHPLEVIWFTTDGTHIYCYIIAAVTEGIHLNYTSSTIESYIHPLEVIWFTIEGTHIYCYIIAAVTEGIHLNYTSSTIERLYTST